MSRRIFRYEVPVDDRWHAIRARAPLYVACRQVDAVEFWAWEPGDDPPVMEYRVFGTGHPIDEPGSLHVGTAISTGGGLIWHLVRRP